ncbi:MAG: hypothetical protein A4E42_00122 [Methanoregulaceae archaeon PtaU1.Bin222]|nr:MAG: hypothetical protein A4E42_00122 [Methanoregulaceae archaeon PtaU1.Bin222]
MNSLEDERLMIPQAVYEATPFLTWEEGIDIPYGEEKQFVCPVSQGLT